MEAFENYTPIPTTPQMAAYFEEMRAKGYKPVLKWARDTSTPQFKTKLQKDVESINAADAKDGIYEFLEAVYDTSEWK
jgi:hypothetical protein